LFADSVAAPTAPVAADAGGDADSNNAADDDSNGVVDDDDVGYYSDDDRPEFTSTDSELFSGESDDDDFDGFDS
jgi:hypothetical protein